MCIYVNENPPFFYQAVDYLQRRYRIVLRSTMGPIDLYLVRYFFMVLKSFTSRVYNCNGFTIAACHKFRIPDLSFSLSAILVNLKKSLKRLMVLMLHPNFHPVQMVLNINQQWSRRIEGRTQKCRDKKLLGLVQILLPPRIL